MQPWSPLPEHLRSYPCKTFQEKSSVQPIYFKKEARSQHQLIQKVSLLKTLQSGFWANKIQNGAYKSPSLFISNSFASHTPREYLQGRFQKSLSELGSLQGRATHQLRRYASAWFLQCYFGRALRIRRALCVGKGMLRVGFFTQ